MRRREQLSWVYHVIDHESPACKLNLRASSLSRLITPPRHQLSIRCPTPPRLSKMTTLPLSSWDHSLFNRLQHLLSRVTAQPTTSTLRKLFASLEEAQPWLLALTQLPGPSEEDRLGEFLCRSKLTQILRSRPYPESFQTSSPSRNASQSSSLSKPKNNGLAIHLVQRWKYPCSHSTNGPLKCSTFCESS